jgi:hypothetical protein
MTWLSGQDKEQKITTKCDRGLLQPLGFSPGEPSGNCDQNPIKIDTIEFRRSHWRLSSRRALRFQTESPSLHGAMILSARPISCRLPL